MNGQPRNIQVVAFCCRFCAYSAADLAGGARLEYPASVKIVEMPCTGRANVLEVLHAFEKGADGVAVAGCLPGTCHFIKGNDHAAQRMDHVTELLKKIGLEEQRARMINISAAMGEQFTTEMTAFVESVKHLGPSPLHAGANSSRHHETPDPELSHDCG